MCSVKNSSDYSYSYPVLSVPWHHYLGPGVYTIYCTQGLSTEQGGHRMILHTALRNLGTVGYDHLVTVVHN